MHLKLPGSEAQIVRTSLLLVLAAAVIYAQNQAAPDKLIDEGHWKRARILVDRKLQESPDDPEAAFLASQVHAAFGDRATAPAFAEKAVRLDPNVARYHRQLAEIQGLIAQHAGLFQQLGLGRRFRKEIDAALALDPRDTQALRDLLQFYIVAPSIVGGDLNKADEMAEKIAAINAAEGFLAKARVAEARNDSARTGDMLRRAAEAKPPSYKARLALAQYFLAPEHRDLNAAEGLGMALVAMDGSRIGGYNVLAGVYAFQENWAQLDAVLSFAAEGVSDDPTPFYRAADVLLTSGRKPDRAAQYLKTYLAQEPEGNEPTAADAHYKFGMALHAEGHENRAVEEWRTAAKLDPASAATRELKRAHGAAAPADSPRPGGPN